MVYLTADTHFGDDSIRRYENRPFATVDEMDKSLVTNWNNRVKPDDIVYVLGDFAVRGREKEILAQLQGQKILVKGNHDVLTNSEYRTMGFAEVYDYPIIYENFWIMSHEPLYVNENMPYANLFGHVHGSPVYNTFSSQHYCVSVERTDFAPISMNEVMEKVKKTVK